MATKTRSRQLISIDFLDQLIPADPGTSGTEIDDLLRSINEELTMPLRMVPNNPGNDRVININSIFITNPETGRNKTIPTISNSLPNFTSGTVTLPASSGGTVTVSPGTNGTLTLSSGNFIKMGVSLDSSGQLSVQFGTEGASVAAATAPPPISGTFSLGYIVIENVGGTIQNVENADIYQYVGGGDSGAGGWAKTFIGS